MFTPFGYDPFVGFPPVHSGGNRINRGNRRLRGFLPIWDDFDRMTDEFINDPFLNESIDNSSNNNNAIQGQGQGQGQGQQGQLQQEQKTNNQRLIKGNSNKNRQLNSNTDEKQQGLLSTTRRTRDSNSNGNRGGLSLWNPSWNSLSLNEQINFELDEKDDKYIINAKLNGFNKEDLKLQVKDGLLTISGEMKQEKKDENSYSKSTRFVSRSMNLPKNINEENITAKYENGVLAVNIPKLQKSKQEKKDTIMIE